MQDELALVGSEGGCERRTVYPASSPAVASCCEQIYKHQKAAEVMDEQRTNKGACDCLLIPPKEKVRAKKLNGLCRSYTLTGIF
jgi:hypothetical protein